MAAYGGTISVIAAVVLDRYRSGAAGRAAGAAFVAPAGVFLVGTVAVALVP